MVVCSPEIQKYFDELERKTKEAHSYANEARKQGRDPEPHVDIPLAASVPEKVEALMAAVAPQIRGSGVTKRIQELELQYGSGDWRVALIVAREIAEQKFCKFDQQIDAISIGIRTGLAYVTQGTVSAPLEGIVDVKFKKRRDGKDYIAVYYAGPIRGAGGTGQSVSVIIADYVRKSLGIEEFDPDENEVNRFYTEVIDYYDRVERKQYRPSKEEMDFLIKNIKVQIDGDQTSEIEVSNFKHLDRVETDKIRGGVALVFLDGISLKANKLWRQLAKWGKDFGLEDWCWLDDFLKLKEKLHAALGGGVKEDVKIKPDFYFLSEVVAGRPVFSYPLAKGGFRLRYGKTRMTGYGSWSIAPTTMLALNQYLAVGSQLRVERPGKSTALTVCDYIDGPIVKLKDGSVVKLETEEQTKKLVKDITEILFLGDILISHGDFMEQGHKLMPAAYVPEFWIQEVKKACEDHKVLLSDVVGTELAEQLLRSPIKTKISLEQAKSVSEKLGVPLHPDWTFFWNELSMEQFSKFNEWLKSASSESEPDPEIKRGLELIGCPHEAKDKKVKIDQKLFEAMKLASINEIDSEAKQPIDAINKVSNIKFRCKSGYTIGARMGRPEKAKMRTMKSTPHGLFPVGKEGDRLRSINAALEHGKVTADFSIYYCELCKAETIYPRCPECDSITRQLRHCPVCRKKTEDLECHRKTITYEKIPLEINKYFNYANKLAKLRQIPPVIKGIRGTSNKDHIPENLIKPLLRAKYNLYVNKDGTIRYDGSELGMTHFKPREIGTSIEKIKELGYAKDVYGRPLESDDQMIEIFPQDVVLPACDEGDQIGSDEIFFRVANFVDELLVKFYKMKPFYSLKSKKDLIGHLIIGLAPHTSAGIMSRIIGFSQTSAIFAHPYWHAAQRRDCLAADSFIPIKTSKGWKIVRIGEYINSLNPTEIIDKFGTVGKTVDNNHSPTGRILQYTKHKPSKLLKITLESGHSIKVTPDHKLYNFGLKDVKARSLSVGDSVAVPRRLRIEEKDISELNLIELFKDRIDVMARGVADYVRNLIRNSNISINETLRMIGIEDRYVFNNFFSRDSFPLPILNTLLKQFNKQLSDAPIKYIGIARDHVNVYSTIPINKEILEFIGLYIAEGCTRKHEGEKSFYQVSIASTDRNIQDQIVKTAKTYFNLNPSHIRPDCITFSSRILYELFTNFLEVGAGAKKKRIPQEFLALPLEKMSAILRGYYTGDGSVSLTDRRISCDSVSEGLLEDISFELARYGIFTKKYTYRKRPGPTVREFYVRKGREIPIFKITKLIITSDFCDLFEPIGFLIERKSKILSEILKKSFRGMRIKFDDNFAYPQVKKIEELKEEETYCLTASNHKFIANGILVHNCDGEETAVILSMDAFLNFSRQYLPDSRGSRSVTADTMIFVEENSEFKAVKIGDYINDLMQEEGFLIENDGFEVLENNRKINAVSFDKEGKAKLCNISKFIRHINDKKVYHIKTVNGEIKITEDHSLFIMKNSEIIPVRGSKLKVGDKIAGLPKLNKIDLKQILNSKISEELITNITEIDYQGYVYDLEVPDNQNFLCGPHPIFAHNSMDAPLVASIILNPKEVDDEVYDVDAVWEYSLDFYLATLEFKPANAVKIEQIRDRVGSPKQYEGIGYTHWVSDMNAGVRVSAYKSLPTMLEKMAGQIDLAKKIRAVSFSGVSELIVDKHFLRDIKGNLRKFTTQSFRCVTCNTIHRRMPMTGVCVACKGKLVYTIAEGTIKKYLQPSLDLAANGSVPEYMTQTLEILKKRIDSIFGEEKTKQVGLGSFF